MRRAKRTATTGTTLPALRLGTWQATLATEEVDAQISDPPYGARTHASDIGSRYDGSTTAGLAPTYDAFTADHVHELVRSWSPRTRGWMANITSYDLIPAWEAAYTEAGRYAFAPVGILCTGMGVRMLGDGPASWMLYLMVARPRRE